MLKSIVLIMALSVCLGPLREGTADVEVIKFTGLQQIFTKKSDKLQVINFWATWCAPCIKELPYFEAAGKTYSDKIEVTLISLDFVEDLDRRVKPFVSKRKLESKVVLLDEIDYNSWIDKVDPSWSGAIPATFVINPKTGKRKFVEKELEKGELEQMLKEFLN